tara:strand:+ start:206 stop:349 length:144 start_codon:yes stop_codon:yes gene_type:complete
MTKIKLLSLGIDYDRIDTLSSEEVESLLLVDEIIRNRENEEALKNSF